MAEIHAPVQDDVKFFTVSLKLSPATNARLEGLKKDMGLTKAKFFGALINAGHALYTGDDKQVEAWKKYGDAVIAEQKTGATGK